jgi:hypothetical protein
MKTLERYEQICMNYFNGNLGDFRKNLKGLTKKEILVLEFNLAVRLDGNPDYKQANNIIHKYL